MLTPTKIYALPSGLLINEFFLDENNPNKISLPSKRTKDLIGITIHNTNDLDNVEDDSEQYTRATYNGNMSTVRTHFYVDDLSAWHNIKLDYMNWTNGDGSTGPGNSQTISIECIMSSSSSTDTMSVKARRNTAQLTAYLLKLYGLTINDIYTHTHWLHISDGTSGSREELNVKPHSYKTCPLYIIPNWDLFLSEVQTYLNDETLDDIISSTADSSSNSITSFLPYLVKVVDPDPNGLNVRELPSFSSNVVTTASTGIYTIVEETVVNGTTFGRLKSGSGWIVIKSGFSERVTS